MLPCLIFEDEHLLVVNKPAGLNTHAPAPFAGEGIYDWLRHREPRWASLAIVHRLDKETSGVLVFARTALANKSLTQQFTDRTVRKTYLLVTDRPPPREGLHVKTSILRAGEKYVSRPSARAGDLAETNFRVLKESGPVISIGTAEFGRGCASRSQPPAQPGRLFQIEASPRTGRTHQIRVHAAAQGFPILGDTLYGGTPASRVYLHAAELAVAHPHSGQSMVFQAPANFDQEPALRLREALLPPDETQGFRIIHGASDGWPGWYVERVGPFLLSQGEQPAGEAQFSKLRQLAQAYSSRGAYQKRLARRMGQTMPSETSPQFLFGEAAPERFELLENGVRFEISFREGYSMGLFLDQRENRRRLLTGHIAASFSLHETQSGSETLQILNAFAYTCAFSVCAARAGARVTSLDLSKKYLEWGKRNFELNGLDPGTHAFLHGDVFDWFRRLAKKGRRFDAVLLDPPTFSQSKASGVFRVQKDYGKLVKASLPLLRRGGVLFASTNAAGWPPASFLVCIHAAIRESERRVEQEHYFPQPPDFPVSREEPAYLKTVWLRVA